MNFALTAGFEHLNASIDSIKSITIYISTKAMASIINPSLDKTMASPKFQIVTLLLISLVVLSHCCGN